MNLYHVKAPEDHYGWDTYDQMVVAAPSEPVARSTHPSKMAMIWHAPYGWVHQADLDDPDPFPDRSWPDPATLEVIHLGVTISPYEPGVVCASFRAG